MAENSPTVLPSFTSLRRARAVVRARRAALRADKRRARAEVHRWAGQLRPGPWVSLADGRAALVLRWPVVRDDLRRAWRRGRRKSLLRRLVLLVADCTAPPFLWWQRGQDPAGGQDRSAGGGSLDGTLVVDRVVVRSRSVVLFDSRSGRVAKFREGGPILTSESLRCRQEMQPYVGQPDHWVEEPDGVHVEQMVTGLPFTWAVPHQRQQAYSRAAARYSAMVSALPPRGGADDLVATLTGDMAGWGVAAMVDGRDCLEVLADVAPHWPLVPSHGDLIGSNCFVADGDLVLIDFECARDLPFFYDLLLLALTEVGAGRGDVVDHPSFPEALASLWASAGRDISSQEVALALVLVAVEHAAYWQRIGVRRFDEVFPKVQASVSTLAGQLLDRPFSLVGTPSPRQMAPP